MVAPSQHNVLAQKFSTILPLLDERQRRLWLAAEARAIGRGGMQAVAAAARVSRVTLRRGMEELEGGVARHAG